MLTLLLGVKNNINLEYLANNDHVLERTLYKIPTAFNKETIETFTNALLDLWNDLQLENNYKLPQMVTYFECPKSPSLLNNKIIMAFLSTNIQSW